MKTGFKKTIDGALGERALPIVRRHFVSTALLLLTHSSFAESYYWTDFLPSAPAAGKPDSTAIYKDHSNLVAWANGYTNETYGVECDPKWQTPDKALGKAKGDAFDIVCLGRGGQITLSFPNGISDGEGADFAVFENALSDGFLELAWVEVSSDGTNFVRFPHYSGTSASVPPFSTLQPEALWGLGGKYRQGYGTPFDLAEIKKAYQAHVEGNTDFSAEYAALLTNHYTTLNFDRISHVRIVDIPGDGLHYGSNGLPIYDPYPTTDSAGFDLDAIGVIHQAIGETLQHIYLSPIPNQLRNGADFPLYAEASSGLPVSLEVVAGSAAILTDPLRLVIGSDTGTVEVRVFQNGNETFAPADDVSMQFEIVDAGASNAPISFSEWFAEHDAPKLGTVLSNRALYLSATVAPQMASIIKVQHSIELTDPPDWSNVVPKTVSATNGQLMLEVPANSTNGFFRLEFSEP